MLVGWWRVELVLFLCLFWWKPSWCWLVGSVQNLRAGHFPLVTLVTLVRPIEEDQLREGLDEVGN